MVSGMVEKDANNNGSPNFVLANKLKGNIKRKTIKQTVMTSVYGVTFIGARDQIYRQVRDQKFLATEM
jgi:DNA-directed RNA polymerase